MHIRLAGALVLVALGALALRAQQPDQLPQPTFRSGIELVELDAIVTDAAGNVVTDLTADDFEILEGGTPQTIATFTLVHIPVDRDERPLYSPTAIEPDVQTNDVPEGRLYVIALDEVSPPNALRTRIFLRRFIEQHFGANDRAAIVLLGRGRRADAQDFTGNRRLLLQAIDRFSGFPDDLPPPDVTGGDGPPPLLLGGRREIIAATRMTALRELMEFMTTLRGRRKAVLLLSEGLAVNMFSVLDGDASTTSRAGDIAREAMRAALRGNVAIYPIDPSGLSPGGAGGEEASTPTSAGSNEARDSLRAIAEVTGGFPLVNSNSFDQTFDRIVRENSTYYILGYYSTDERRNGRYRPLRVRVKRPGLQVRARNGYLAPTGRAPSTPPASARTVSPAVAEAIASPLAVPGVPLRLFAAPYKGAGREASIVVALEIDPRGIDLVETDGTFNGRLEVLYAATDANGKVHPGDRHSVTLALKPDTYERVKAGGMRVLLEPQLPSGRYQLRVAAGHADGPAGSVVYDLEVPDFTKPELAMSGVSLTSARAASVLTARPGPAVNDFLPGPLTATRTFDAGDAITLYAEVYENARNAPAHTVALRVELRTDDGRVIATSSEERSSTELEGRPGGYGFLTALSLQDLEPGLYVIHVHAESRIGARPTVSRDVQIRVR